ncbi:hypothetical protein Brsp07_05447 [Brucella sp. NBRC 14130]|jgi:hypothetical protein|uniref:hypothetical protein n=1 Tax=Hyphomicrobiales TaxID=356 RepID=UPI001F490E65|nr:hypothetical protein [Shinella sp. NM-101]
MNKARRKAIADLIDRLDTLKGIADEIRSEVETIKDAESEAFENLSESFQGSERGQAMEAAAYALEDAVGAMDEIGSTIDQAVGYLNTASA